MLDWPEQIQTSPNKISERDSTCTPDEIYRRVSVNPFHILAMITWSLHRSPGSIGAKIISHMFPDTFESLNPALSDMQKHPSSLAALAEILRKLAEICTFH